MLRPGGSNRGEKRCFFAETRHALSLLQPKTIIRFYSHHSLDQKEKKKPHTIFDVRENLEPSVGHFSVRKKQKRYWVLVYRGNRVYREGGKFLIHTDKFDD